MSHRTVLPLAALGLAALAGCGPRTADTTTPHPDGTVPPAPAPVLLGGMVVLGGGDPVEFLVTLTPRADGGWDGDFRYLIREQLVVPLEDLTYDETVLRFSATPPGAPPEARTTVEVPLAADPPWVGTLAQAGQSVPLSLEPVPQRPQTPQPPFPYTTRELGFTNPDDGAELAGTLTVPEGPGPHPAVLLLTGSGAQNRDYALFWHKPWVVLADHLARRGIATLRFDDRGVGGSTSNLGETTIEILAHDAVAGLEALAAQPDLDPQHLGVLGHSEGASVAALASTLGERASFVVHLAGMGLPGAEILVLQEGLIFAAAGVPPEPIAELQAAHRRLHDLLRDPATDEATLREAARAVVAGQLAIGRDHLGGPNLEVTDELLETSLAIWRAPKTMDWIRFDPVPILSQVRAPILVLNGTKDLQIPCDANLAEIRRLLEQAGNPDATVEALDGLNHAFQPADTGNIDEYQRIDVTFDPGALERIADWIRRHTGLEP